MQNTHMVQWIAPGEIGRSNASGSVSSGSFGGSGSTVCESRTAGDAVFWLFVPVNVPKNSEYRAGCYLTQINVFYEIATAAADDIPTVELDKMTFSTSGSVMTPSSGSVAVTLDTNHDTSAKRKAAHGHKMQVSVDTPVWLNEDEHYVLTIAVDAAATTVFRLYGAEVLYSLKV
jgi:D-serine deaminase-like pyridoxal phosphate-dependent protein